LKKRIGLEFSWVNSRGHAIQTVLHAQNELTSTHNRRTHGHVSAYLSGRNDNHPPLLLDTQYIKILTHSPIAPLRTIRQTSSEKV